MCGIAGYFGDIGEKADARTVLARMIGAIRHRGTDDSGIFAGHGAGLAHARLSIVDLSGGVQPMATEDGVLSVTFNGEIFNYIELRQELMARGHVFRTQSDTEVILHAYRAWGADCVSRFNGDFAFALWDSRAQRLMLARDRMGVRPLFYTRVGEALYFASEAKALLQAPGVAAELDEVALDQIFTFWFPLAPRTPFKNISELPPAHVLMVTPQKIEIRRYWQLEYPHAEDAGALDARSETAIAEELRALLKDATAIRLRADVPVGSYLSGGLDSSIVTAQAKALAPSRLSTFSVTFDSPEFDESAQQLEMVRALGTEHSSVACTSDTIAASFPDVIRHTERPILRTAPAPLFALSKLVRERGLKVVLTGEGADEVFAGYDIFKEAKLRRFCARQPDSRIRPLLFKRLYPYLPNVQDQPLPYLQAFFATGHARPGDPLFSHAPRFKTTSGAKLFFSGDLRKSLLGYDAVAELRASLPWDFTRWHPLSQAQYLETAFLLPGYILSSQGDRVAMAHAVEGRFPFLDHRVVECATRIPPALKIRGLREKHILRESTKHLLPQAIVNRTKQPYRAPEALSFFGTNAPAYVAERLSSRNLTAAGYFDAAAVEKLTRKCIAGHAGGARENMALVGVLSTQLWREAFAARAPHIQPASAAA
jgi:asparagine synthase (glutamine-hydrolysing)